MVIISIWGKNTIRQIRFFFYECVCLSVAVRTIHILSATKGGRILRLRARYFRWAFD